MHNIFRQLDTFLCQTQVFWRFEPFHSSGSATSPWCQMLSELDDWLDALSETQIFELKQQPDQLIAYLAYFIAGLEKQHHTLAQFLVAQPLAGSTSSHIQGSDSLYSGIPGRKVEQIQQLGLRLLNNHHGHSWLEWCAGKGYLGRWLASHSSLPVVSFEYQQTLCEQGQADADRLGLPMTFVQGDAFDASSQSLFQAHQHAVALHACGDLHVRLMQYAVKGKLAAVTLSPCCYHLIQGESYCPLSEVGMSSSLHLTRNELRIPLQETVTGGERVKRHRQLEMSYRLGLDELLKAELGHQEYLPIPSIRKSQLSDGFPSFCLWAAKQKAFMLPAVDFAGYQQKGWRRFWRMERLSLVQQGFRRLLEMWLVLDKALFLQEQGYQVSVSEFCSRDTTPRNLVIHAQKKDNRA